ncbi:MAG: MerR family transcriptional regulator [Lachnospiraceae bacterium]|nr:MerR family transcriptional regulator [Lachnospiraceae bacterium]
MSESRVEGSAYSAEYTLTVGQFAKLCRTSRDTLRYYYEQKILMPRVDPDNGYHYYSASQISSFFFISTMRQAGCSIREITDIIYNLSQTDIVDLLNVKIHDMQRELINLNKKVNALHLGTWMIEQYGNHRSGVPFVASIPPISVTSTPVHRQDGSYHAADIAGDISVHLAKSYEDDSLMTFPSGATIAYDDFVKGNYAYNNVITLSLMPADYRSSFPLPSRRAVLCAHSHNEQDISRSYKKILAYLKRNKLNACSDLYSVSLINLYDNETNHRYYKYLLICVE